MCCQYVELGVTPADVDLSGVGDETRDSRCLIVDLDHAALLSEATEPNRPATTQRTGAHSHTVRR